MCAIRAEIGATLARRALACRVLDGPGMTHTQPIRDEGSIRALTERCAAAMHAAPRPATIDVARAERATLRWAQLMGLVDRHGAERLLRIGCGRFAALTYPTAGEEVVQIGADLIAWLYLFDDAHGEAGDEAMFAAVAAVVRGACPGPGASRFLFAMDDLCRRATRHVGAAWRERFCRTLEHYFAGCRRETPWRKARRVPSLATYRHVRRGSVGALPVFALLELQGELSSDEAAAPALLRLALLGAGLCAWVNDVYSYEKERRDGEPLNLVAVLEAERGGTIAEAFTAAATLYNDDLARFEAAAHHLTARPDTTAAQRRFVEGLRMWVHGNHAWTAGCGRY